MRIFFLGGTFDPPHLGHLAIAKKCLEHKHCDRFIFIPSKQNPTKSSPYFSDFDRSHMLNIMYSDMSDYFQKNTIIDLFEVESGDKVNYSINTIKYLLKEYNPTSLYMVIGQDLLPNLKEWKEWEQIKKMVKIVCINRPGYEYVSDIDISIKFDNISMDIDSTLIRDKIESKDFTFSSVKGLIPTGICNYILSHKNHKNI